ncbi:proline-, glutamic acid- and leucine-rich protein 1 [Pygocentrus nattereri]|uniref:PH domain-containing protein n=1 Tax=Pygocentrus nattereri TaxID=42514 RepID=A0AAR2LNS0_PYGNA|nr:proline-, glutamic acid- and leucine-rich protein 1 [Pygocentrus nattereri]
MEDGVKEDPAKPKEVKSTGKAGWLKKSSGKFLGSYKDRYIQLDRTEIVVYDNEDFTNCLERLDLENFDKCHELRSVFKKKNRLILIGSQKSGSKVSSVKLQAESQEEKDAWIKALSDGINRAKNKIFDEVKVDEGLSLEHVTRSRPKGNRGRRPPTRIHMKEAANVSVDGILRLDLDGVEGTPNGTHVPPAEGSETGKPETTPSKSLGNIPEESGAEEGEPQKKVVKPPMPPSKENKPSESQENEPPQKKVLMPPMPPSKEKKPSKNTEEEETSEVIQEKRVLTPPMPPSKENKLTISANGDATRDNVSDSGVESGAVPSPSKSSPTLKETDDTESNEPASPKTTTHPPTPPSKDKKPSQALSLKKQDSLSEDNDVDQKDDKDHKDDKDDKDHEDDKDDKDDIDDKDDKDDIDDKDSKVNEDVKDDSIDSQKAVQEEDKVKTEDTAFILSNNVPKPQGVCWDSPSTALENISVEVEANKSAALDVTQAKTPEPAKPVSELKLTPHSTPEAVKKGPPAPPKKKPLKPPVKTGDDGPESVPAVSPSSSLPTTVTSSESKSVPQNDPKPDTQETKGENKVVLPSCNPTEDDISGLEVEVEEKSVDSGQLSAEDSESGDQVTSSTDKLEGSLQGLDEEISEEDLESCDSKAVDEPSPAILTVTPNAAVESSSTSPPPRSPATPLTSKTRAASTGDLLELHVAPQGSDMKDLQSKVSIELEETGKLLGEIGLDHEGESSPEILLATAMEKLRQADQFLREAKSFKELENKSNRTSW